jgi:Spy/CpxP family protein refolding chaperone
VKVNVVVAIAAGTWLACGALAAAQAPAQAPASQDQHVLSSQEIDMLRKDIRSQKKQLIAQNLHLTDTEATKFWPIYDKYTAELVKINDTKYAALQEYADKFGTLTDDQAMALSKKWLDVDIAAAQLRAKYLPIFAQAVGGKKAATFSQIDRRITHLIELQLSAHTPLVQSQ